MNKWFQVPDETKVNAYNQIAEKTGMSPFAVEKDWWVVQTLSVVFDMEVGHHLVFKGGTSLSKAWKLIQRFSEDVDLAIDRSFLGFHGELNKSQRTNLRKTAGKYATGPFFDELQQKFTQKGLKNIKFQVVEAENSDEDPRIINIYYPHVIDIPGYLEPRVQIEIGCRSLKEPFSPRTIGSLIDEYYPDQDFAIPLITVPSVNPERTFLEKIFLLHEEFQRPRHKIRVYRLSRHLYDIERLAQSDFAAIALNDQQLYSAIVQHRHIFSPVGGVDYNSHQPQTINFIPPSDSLDAWRDDYRSLAEQMIYEENPLTFDQLINRLEELQDKVNNVTWRFETEFPIPYK